MMRYIAFLRGINVGGGHIVKMETLRQAFESLGLLGSETFIASGNLIFETCANDPQALERMIEGRLRGILGYEVATFVRTEAQLAEIAEQQPFGQQELDSGAHLYIVFLADALGGNVRQRLEALSTSTDEFRVRDREIYWRHSKVEGGGGYSTVPLEKTLGAAFTVRGAKTVKRMAARLLVPPS